MPKMTKRFLEARAKAHQKRESQPDFAWHDWKSRREIVDANTAEDVERIG